VGVVELVAVEVRWGILYHLSLVVEYVVRTMGK
jgi:hypothetical protein